MAMAMAEHEFMPPSPRESLGVAGTASCSYCATAEEQLGRGGRRHFPWIYFMFTVCKTVTLLCNCNPEFLNAIRRRKYAHFGSVDVQHCNNSGQAEQASMHLRTALSCAI
jgi:hypothetical protein